MHTKGQANIYIYIYSQIHRYAYQRDYIYIYSKIFKAAIFLDKKQKVA